MFRRSVFAVVLLVGLGWVRPISSQTPIGGWTERPDARAPAGVNEDALLVPGTFEARYSMDIVNFEGLKVGTEEIPAILVLRDWDLAALSMTAQRHELELRAGILDWLGASLTVPFLHTSTEFASELLRGNPSTSGIGDLEVHALLGLHDGWPYRAHLITGSISSDWLGRGGGPAPQRDYRRSGPHPSLSDATRGRHFRAHAWCGLRS